MERVIIKDLWKMFNINTAGSRFKKAILLKKKKKLIVLKGISFNVKAGEYVGIIGKIGAGKSTLLRLIAGIYKKDKGNVIIKGKSLFHSGLGAGLNERLSMEQNIFLIGAFLGLSKKEISSKFNEIVKMSGLEKFTKTKIFQFSEGMKARLIFSIMAHSKSKILLVDELNVAGDKDFFPVAYLFTKNFLNNGGCIIATGHNLDVLKEYCTRILWLDDGKIKMDGKPGFVIKEYLKNPLVDK